MKEGQITILSPRSLSIISTDKCTASCKNCCFGCNPKNKNQLTYSEMQGYIDQALEQFNTIKLLVITGGECFLLGRDLDKIIKYASERSLFVRVVTNAYWAKSFKVAYCRLLALKEAGLKELNVSTGEEHQEWVNFNNIVNIIVAAIYLDIIIAVNIETPPSSVFTSRNILEDNRLKKFNILNNKKVIIINGTWMFFKKQTEHVQTERTSCKNSRCTSLFQDLIVSSKHYMYACCGLTCMNTSILYLGNLKEYNFSFLYKRQFEDFIKIWLFTEGPTKILHFVQSKRGETLTDTRSWHICKVCVEVFQNEGYLNCLRDNYKEVFSNVILKYSLLIKKIGMNN